MSLCLAVSPDFSLAVLVCISLLYGIERYGCNNGLRHELSLERSCVRTPFSLRVLRTADYFALLAHYYPIKNCFDTS